jgi:hypothetical protein
LVHRGQVAIRLAWWQGGAALSSFDPAALAVATQLWVALGRVFVGDTLDELLADLDRVAERVLPAFA